MTTEKGKLLLPTETHTHTCLSLPCNNKQTLQAEDQGKLSMMHNCLCAAVTREYQGCCNLPGSARFCQALPGQ